MFGWLPAACLAKRQPSTHNDSLASSQQGGLVALECRMKMDRTECSQAQGAVVTLIGDLSTLGCGPNHLHGVSRLAGKLISISLGPPNTGSKSQTGKVIKNLWARRRTSFTHLRIISLTEEEPRPNIITLSFALPQLYPHKGRSCDRLFLNNELWSTFW